MCTNHDTMKAAVVHQFKENLEVQSVPKPHAGNGQVLVHIKASGVCHTDCISKQLIRR